VPLLLLPWLPLPLLHLLLLRLAGHQALLLLEWQGQPMSVLTVMRQQQQHQRQQQEQQRQQQEQQQHKQINWCAERPWFLSSLSSSTSKRLRGGQYMIAVC
jgi:hypothetical protein